MVVYEEKSFNSLWELKEICWSGALQRIEEVEELEEEKQKAFVNYIMECLGDEEHLTTTELNDFIWFECDAFIEELKEEEDEEED